MRNCEKCGALYSPYMKNGVEDIGAYWRQTGDPTLQTKGICQFDNTNSSLYNPKQL